LISLAARLPTRHHPSRKGFFPSVKIAGRYRAKPSTDKQKIDLSVKRPLFVNILKAMARLFAMQSLDSTAFPKRRAQQKTPLPDGGDEPDFSVGRNGAGCQPGRPDRWTK
jgi:hypothetical protein